jgi:hypothetical protein
VPVGNLQKRLAGRENSLQPVDQVAQVAASLGFIRIGVKQKGRLLPQDRLAALEQQVCQQLVEARVIQAGEYLTVGSDPELTE